MSTQNDRNQALARDFVAGLSDAGKTAMKRLFKDAGWSPHAGSGGARGALYRALFTDEDKINAAQTRIENAERELKEAKRELASARRQP